MVVVRQVEILCIQQHTGRLINMPVPGPFWHVATRQVPGFGCKALHLYTRGTPGSGGLADSIKAQRMRGEAF